MTSRDPNDRPTIEEVLDQDWFASKNVANTPIHDSEQKLREAYLEIERLKQENDRLKLKLGEYEKTLL